MNLNHLEFNQDDQECQERSSSVLFKETVLIKFLHLKPHICYLFRILGTHGDQLYLFQSLDSNQGDQEF